MTVLVYDNNKTTPPTTKIRIILTSIYPILFLYILYLWTFYIFIFVCMFIVESDGE